MKNRVQIITLMAVLTGCANPLYLRHESKLLESQEYFKDRTECKAYASTSAPITYSKNKTSDEMIAGRNDEEWTVTYYECMRGYGWYAVDKDGNRINYKY